MLRNDCSCPGYNLTFECTVNGSINIGSSTLWRGEVFQNSCMISELYLRHREFLQGTSQTCKNNDVILHAYSLQVGTIDTENGYNSYTSQLNITYSTSLIGSTVVCAYENGTQVTHTGSKIITTNTKCMHNIRMHDVCMLHVLCLHSNLSLIQFTHHLLASI